jgi:ABC-type proline/glycine betaine transport system permease subunit
MNRPSVTKAKNLISGICAVAVFALLFSVVSINAQTTLPAITGVSFQTITAQLLVTHLFRRAAVRRRVTIVM